MAMVADSDLVPVAPGSLPFAGHALKILRSPLPFFSSLPGVGDLVEVQLGRQPAYVACTAELTHEVLADPHTYDKGGPQYDLGRKLVGDGLITSMFEPHRRQRRLLQPAFRRDRIAGYTRIFSDVVTKLSLSWREGSVVDVSAAMYEMTARSVARALLDVELSQRAGEEIQRSLPVFLHGVLLRTALPERLVPWLAPRSNRRYEEAVQKLHALVDEMIVECRAAGTDRGDIISTMLTDSPDALSDQEIHDQVISLLSAGTDTTAAASTWALYLLSTHPDIAAQVSAEANTVLAGRLAAGEDIPKLDLTRRVVMETLRLYPPGWFFTRVVSRPATLGGHHLPTGSIVIYSPYMMHRLPGNFAAPEEFDPDRWLPARVKSIPKGGYVPFAAGTRQCIGDQFATTEIMTILATITSHWQLDPANEKPIQPAPRTVLHPDRVRVLVRHREGLLNH